MNEAYPVYREMEHQELWYPDADLTRPVDVHIPSALGTLAYYVCVRVPVEHADKLGGIEFEAKIGGLRPEDLRISTGEGMGGAPDCLPSKAEGRIWRLLCRAHMSRGDGVVRLLNWPAAFGRANLLLCTWPRYIASGQADDWLACQADPHWAPTGIPLGGIGCGKVDICRDGRFRNFTANNNQDVPFEDPAGVPGAWLGVAEGDDVVSLTTSPVDGAAACPALEFTGRFPQAALTADNCLPGVNVRVLASGMLCPHDLVRSALPAMLTRWRVVNTTDRERSVRCLFNWPNLIGFGGGIGQEETDIGKGDGIYCYWEETDGRAEAKVETDAIMGLAFTGKADAQRLNSAGTHLLAVRRGADAGVEAADHRGCIWQTLTLPPNGEATADIALVWAMPHWVDTKGVDRGHFWLNHFEQAADIAAEVIENADLILDNAAALANLFDQTALPEWLTTRMANCNYPLVTNSVLYRDGRFSINEGPTEMAGCYGTIDQRLGSHPATQLLFPELNDKELSEFAEYQSPNGGINHDLGHGHLESGPRDQNWPDIPCSFIIQIARHAWSTGDAEFEKAMWPKARAALLRDAIWADEGGGVAQTGSKTKLGTSYDGYHYEGTTPYLGTLWLAALDVCEKWAKRAGDADLLPRIERWRTAAIERMEADLWNGEFYHTCGGKGLEGRATCFAGALAGQVFSRMLAGRDVLPADRLLPCADAIVRLNCSDKFNVPTDEATPAGDSAVMYGWLPYVEAFGLTAAATLGDTRIMPVWERMIASVNDKGRRPCDTRLMYRPVSGNISWGSYYMTAPASWLVYDALLDFFYTPADGCLRLNPCLAGKLAVVHPLWWGLAEVSDESISLKVERVFTGKPIAVSCICLLDRTEGGNATYQCNKLAEPVAIEPGAVIEWGRK